MWRLMVIFLCLIIHRNHTLLLVWLHLIWSIYLALWSFEIICLLSNKIIIFWMLIKLIRSIFLLWIPKLLLHLILFIKTIKKTKKKHLEIAMAIKEKNQ